MGGKRWIGERVFVYRHSVDMRKGMDGLAALVTLEFGRNPMDRCSYVFTNKNRDKIKLLIWHLNGYWVLYKRLEKQRFKWPDWFEGDSLTLTQDQLDYLLDGYDLNGMRPHRAVSYAAAF